MASVITLQQTVNFASIHGDLMPLCSVGGYSQQPALEICNDTIQEMLAEPVDWKFNRRDNYTFVTAPVQQDYLIAGATAFTLNQNIPGNNTAIQSVGAQIDLASNAAVTCTAGVVTVNFIQGQMQHQIVTGSVVYLTGLVSATTSTATTAANYNAVQVQNAAQFAWNAPGVICSTVTSTAANSITFAAGSGMNNGDVLGAPGIYDFGWLQSATSVELNNDSPIGNVRPVEAVRNLPLYQLQNNPTKMCFLNTFQNAAGQDTGVIKLRLEYPCGETMWTMTPVYQAKAPIKTSLDQTWAPFPDELSYAYRQGLVARMYRFLNSNQQVAEFQKAEAAIKKATGQDDQETSDVHVYPEASLVDATWFGNIW